MAEQPNVCFGKKKMLPYAEMKNNSRGFFRPCSDILKSDPASKAIICDGPMHFFREP